MEQRTLGRTGLRVSALGFGCGDVGGLIVRGTPAERERAVRRAIDAGVILPNVDLLIRTGGEQRLSDFLLWECAYAELYFTETMWPDFGAGQLAAAIAEFHTRQRRFGGLPEAAAG